MKIQSKIACNLSRNDELFVAAIENNNFHLAEFNHAAHVKLAYCYLAQAGLENSIKKMSQTLKSYLLANGVDGNKFHVTITHAWIRAVWYFMKKSEQTHSADEFIKTYPALLNKDILLSHYSHNLLFSDRARSQFVYPDISPIPE